MRLKKYLEVRSIDECEWDCHCAGPAFYTGLIYGNLEESLDTISDTNNTEEIYLFNDEKEDTTLEQESENSYEEEDLVNYDKQDKYKQSLNLMIKFKMQHLKI